MRTVFLLLAMVISLQLSAQLTLNRATHSPRTGDCIIKQQVVFQSPGMEGLGLLWDFSDLENIKDNYTLKYIAPSESSDTIIGIEHRVMSFYMLSGDSLLSKGSENPTTSIKFSKPEILLIYPFPYGRSVTSYFTGTGNYCGQLDINLAGKLVVTADAMGAIVLPGGDSLQNVLRVHAKRKILSDLTSMNWRHAANMKSKFCTLQNDSINWYLINDSSYIEIDTWQWYAAGYRYPVFESIKNVLWESGKVHESSSLSYYYPPHEQYYGLDNDPINQEVRDDANQSNFSMPELVENGYRNEFQDEVIRYGYTFIGDELILDYSLKNEADVTIVLYDFQGRQLSAIEKKHRFNGSFREKLPVVQLDGQGFLLHIQVNDEIYGEKILDFPRK